MIETQDAPAATGRRKHRTVWILGSVAAVLLVLVLVHLFERKPVARGAAPQVVKVAVAARGDMPETLSELGTVTPARHRDRPAAVERLSDRGRL